MLPEQVTLVLSALNDAGYEAYLVGGCVRDMLRGVQPHDFDITTSALPEETAAVFRGYRVIETGIKHGTVTVLCDGEPLEITTFRVDGSYTDSRHPDSVSFSRSLNEDLARRDFCCNAIACTKEGGIIDPFGGQADIKEKRLRTVGDAEKRFSEDALRIMRGLRFASVLGYSIDPAAESAMRKLAPRLRLVSGERRAVELMKLLCGDGAGDIIRNFSDVLDYVVPGIAAMKGFEQHNRFHVRDVLDHTAVAVDNVPAVPYLRLAALLHDFGKPDSYFTDDDGRGHFWGHGVRSAEMAREIMAELKLDRETSERVEFLVLHHDDEIPSDERAMLRKLGKIGEDALRGLIAIHRADVIAQNPAPEYINRLIGLDESERLLDRLCEEKRCCRVEELAVGGKDLIAAGYCPGPEIGAELNRLLERVIDGELANERDALLAEIAGFKNI